MAAVDQAAAPARDQGAVAPLTGERVKRHLDAHGWAYTIDDDGRIVGAFNGHPFSFLVTGVDHNLLQVRGRWARTLPLCRKDELVRLCNRWNMERIWPKVYARRDGDDEVHLYAEVCADFSCGATDEQIDRALRSGLKNALRFFDDVADDVDGAPGEEDDSPAPSDRASE